MTPGEALETLMRIGTNQETGAVRSPLIWGIRNSLKHLVTVQTDDTGHVTEFTKKLHLTKEYEEDHANAVLGQIANLLGSIHAHNTDHRFENALREHLKAGEEKEGPQLHVAQLDRPRKRRSKPTKPPAPQYVDEIPKSPYPPVGDDYLFMLLSGYKPEEWPQVKQELGGALRELHAYVCTKFRHREEFEIIPDNSRQNISIA